MTPYSEKELEEATAEFRKLRNADLKDTQKPDQLDRLLASESVAIILYMQNRRLRDALDCARIALELSRKTLSKAGGGDMPTLNRVIDMAREALAGGDGDGF